MESDEICYQALCANDPRFDGLFFVGISTTGIYCRSVCPARRAKRSSCTFYSTAASAECNGYRPCLRCRPELAPGVSPYEEQFSKAAAIITQIQAGALNGTQNLEDLALRHDLSTRQLRRWVKQHAGVNPVQLAQTSRLLLAKQLLTETRLPITEIAFASGFASLRRFNELFALAYRMPPSRFRKGHGAGLPDSPIELFVSYRPPLAWQALLDFLSKRAIPGAEQVTQDGYYRTIRLEGRSGWLRVQHAPAGNRLSVMISPSLVSVLQPLLASVRELFDLNARPDLIEGHLSQSQLLEDCIPQAHGLRVPGAMDGFELAWRAVLGQQVSVRGASTLSGRFANQFGVPLSTPHPGLQCLSPRPSRVAKSSVAQVAQVGLPKARAASLIALARLCHRKPNLLRPGTSPSDARAQLLDLPGIGPWTAEYILMRALRWPDAFPTNDLGLRKALENRGAKCNDATAEPWRPWRSYAALHLWASLSRQPV